MRRFLRLLLATPVLLGLSLWAQPSKPSPDPPAVSQDEKVLLPKATAGNAQAQLELGKLYARRQDFALAAKWYLKAALNGNAEAQNRLGVLYDKGLGVEKSGTQAVKWFRRASELGYAQSQVNLAYRLAKGLGVDRNEAEAVSWLRKAAASGNAWAKARLYLAYQEGSGVPRNLELATRWLLGAAESGNSAAQAMLGGAYAIKSDDARSKLADIPHDSAKATYWLSKAADQGSALALFGLGEVYYDGDGVPANYETAYRYFLCARALGYNGRKQFVDSLPDKMTRVQARSAERAAADWWDQHPDLQGEYHYYPDETPSSNANVSPEPGPRKKSQPSFSAETPSRSAGSGCESGHWVRSVSDDGGVLTLEDESVWLVGEVDRVDSMLWLPADDVISCEGYLVNTGSGEKVSAVRLQ